MIGYVIMAVGAALTLGGAAISYLDKPAPAPIDIPKQVAGPTISEIRDVVRSEIQTVDLSLMDDHLRLTERPRPNPSTLEWRSLADDPPPKDGGWYIFYSDVGDGNGKHADYSSRYYYGVGYWGRPSGRWDDETLKPTWVDQNGEIMFWVLGAEGVDPVYWSFIGPAFK